MADNTEQKLLSLFEAFALKCMQLQQAIRVGDDRLVRLLDRELEPLVASILAYKAGSVFDVYMQMQFLSNLIREDADDRSSVMRHSAALSVLLDRYFGGQAPEHYGSLLREMNFQKAAAADVAIGDDIVFNDILLDSLPDRIAVITRDYRFLYSNPANAAAMNRYPIDLVGRHLVDFIGADCFAEGLKAPIDRCFAGAEQTFRHICHREGADPVAVAGRIKPLRMPAGPIFGAALIWNDEAAPQA